MDTHIQQYRLSQVSGMTQKELILMLYRGAMRFLTEARAAIVVERFDQSCVKLDRARKIVLHLYTTLNLEAGSIAKDLASLYSYVVEQICVANARRETEPIDVCLDVLDTIKQAWEQLPDTEKSEAAPDAELETVGAEPQPVGLSFEA